MHYQLFLPQKTAQNPQHLVEAGLADHVAGVNWVELRAGPGGQPGMLACWPRPGAPAPGYLPDRQTWLPAAGRGPASPSGPGPSTPGPRPYWVGFANDAPPGPEDLRRAALFDGYFLPLGDGRPWAIPKAVLLPQDLTLAADGALERTPQERFREFWKQSEIWYRRMALCNLDELTIRGEEGLTAAELDRQWWDYLLAALNLNYRVVPEAASRLKLFNTANRVQCVLATVEGHVIRDVLEELSSGDGEPHGGGQKKTAGTPAGS